MPHFRRAYVPGGSFFFTVVTEQRAPILCTDTSRLFLRTAILECRQRWPFRIDAMVLLDNHLHAILTLPEGDTRSIRHVGNGSRRSSPRRIWPPAAKNNRLARHGFGKGGAGFYNAGSGNMPCGTKMIMPGTSIISTITRLNMGT